MGSRRVQGPSARESAARATAVILEDIRSQNKVVLEAVNGLAGKVEGLDGRLGVIEQKVDGLDVRMGAVEQGLGRLEHDLSSLRAELLQRITRLEDAVLENSRRLQSVEAELRAIKEALAAKADAAALAALELRVAALERRARRG